MRAPTFPTGIVRNFIGYIGLNVPLNIDAPVFLVWAVSPHCQSQQPKQFAGQGKKKLMFPTAGALPTPVLVEKLAFYLEGYDGQISQVLVLGFVYDFRLHFQGTQHGQFSRVCNQPCKTQRLLTVSWIRKFVKGEFGALLFSPHSIT